MSEKAWSAVQLALLPIFLWHTSITLLSTDRLAGNYEYYIIAFAVVLLFLPYKEFFLKLVLVYFYVLSTAAKIHPSWIEGGYFTSLKTGLPLFPDWSIPVFTNFVIIMEMIGAWFLMSRNLLIQKIIFVAFVFFHLYSGILVEYRYPATVLPFLLILFGPWYRYTPVPLNIKAIGGWIFILLLTFLQFSPKLIPGDEKLTMEGNKYGLYMFEANHQCFSEAIIHLNNGETEEINIKSTNARNRCDPYPLWFKMKKMCEGINEINFIEWKFYHSINGGPFYKIVDTDEVCDLEFKPFSHNEWIGTEDDSEIFGYPVKNTFN